MSRTILFLSTIYLCCSCTKDIPHILEETVKQTFLFEPSNMDTEEIDLHNINCYIFKDNLFYKTIYNLVQNKQNSIAIDLPKIAQLYFLTNMKEPRSLTTLEEGKTKLSSFLSMRSDETTYTRGEVPEFYSGMITVDPSLDDNKTVKLSTGVARIDIDASSDERIQIDSVEISGASSSSLLFEGMGQDSSTNKQSYLHHFTPPVSGLVSNVFRVYESNTPVNITIRGTYNQTAIVVHKSIAKLERNKIYTLKIELEDIEVAPNTNVHILTPDSKGRLDMEATKTSRIKPGSTVYLKGRFLSIRFIGLEGTAQEPIRITNYPGQTLIAGDPNWSAGAYSNAVQLLECKHIILGGENSKSDFIIEGSIQPKVRASYFGVTLRPFTDHVEVRNMTIKNGGIGISAKTDPVKDDPKTWYPNTVLENLSIHDVEIYGAVGEAMYLGHTSLWWGWDENGRGYNAGAKPNNPAHTYVIPIRWKNVKIYNNYVHHLGWDGIQASAMDQLEIYDNEVTHFGLEKVWGQCMGIIVGGRTTNTHTHDNYVHDGFGELIQFHGAGEGNATHVIQNNLLVNTEGSGMGIYGATDAATIQINNNTVVGCQAYAIQSNGKYFETKVELSNNVFISYYLKDPTFQKYIWVINDSKVEETNNKLFDTPANAMVDPTNYYQPLPGSPIGNAGYKKSPKSI